MTKSISHYLLKAKALSRGMSDFSFGNGGREDTRYVTMFPVHVLGMGLSSSRKAGDVTVALLVNNVEIQEYRASLTNDRPRKHDFDISFEVKQGSVIDFVCKTNSSDMQHTESPNEDGHNYILQKISEKEKQ